MTLLLLRDGELYPRLVFEYDLSEPIAPNGFRGDVALEMVKGEKYPLYFFDLFAIQAEIRSRIEHGMGQFVAEPGMVTLPEITESQMKAAVAELIEIGYFDHLKPLVEAPSAPTETTSKRIASEKNGSPNGEHVSEQSPSQTNLPAGRV
jgi:hypothetical protein